LLITQENQDEENHFSCGTDRGRPAYYAPVSTWAEPMPFEERHARFPQQLKDDQLLADQSLLTSVDILSESERMR